jgi:hypothetical protein
MGRVLDGAADLGTSSDAVVMFTSFNRTDLAVVSTFVTSRNDVKLVARKDRGVAAVPTGSGPISTSVRAWTRRSSPLSRVRLGGLCAAAS